MLHVTTDFNLPDGEGSHKTYHFTEYRDRKESTAYAVGDIATSPFLPSWAILEATRAGTTAATEITVPASVSEGTTITDGTAVWTVRKLLSSDGILPQIIVTSPTSGWTVVAENGSTVLTATESDMTWTFNIPYFGTWTVTSIKDGATTERHIEVDAVKQYFTKTIYRYGFRISESESSPYNRVEYILDAEGMTAAHMDFTRGAFDYGDWGDAWFVTGNKPLMLQNDGTVGYYLNPSNLAQKEDGTGSDIANTSYAGNAMAQFPLCWVKRYEESGYKYEIVADAQFDDTYKAYAHTRADGTIADYFYWSIYGGSGSASKIRSLSGQTLAQSLTAAQEIAGATANGSGWYTHTWSQHELIRTLLVLMGKTTDLQGAFGYGNCRSATAASGMLSTGTLNSAGQFFGYSDATHQVKVFYVEKFWGDQWDRTAGIINNGGHIWYKMTPEGSGYRVTDVSGYTDSGISLSGTNGGYINTASCGEYGIIPKTISGSGSTYYCDGAWYNNSQLDYLLVGASAHNAAAVGGGFTFVVNFAPSYADWSFGCGLTCEMP